MFFINKHQRIGLIHKIIVMPAAVLVLTLGTENAFGQTTVTQQTTAAEQTTEQTKAAEPAATIQIDQPLDAIVSNVTGRNVQVSLDQGKTWQPARKGQALTRGAAVRTGFASSCEINFGDHSILQILALSSVSIADYAGIMNVEEKVQANLQYGAVRCGVEKGRIKTDTKISTPVSTLSVRGTFIYVEYDPGTRRCLLKVDEDGPAVASTFTRDCFGLALDGYYLLNEGMKTDCCLSRFLKLAIFERTVWVTGNYALGDITDEEAHAMVYKDHFGAGDASQGALQFNDDRSRHNQIASEIVITGGGIPIGQSRNNTGVSFDTSQKSTVRNIK
ncbi:MAG: hypothetical protein AMJ79_14580 [Phycisphaerae bacterium SM23_30]|nr:MAG: hypothetical protein AMJ79_14580 [Phycisphaerae bacterium SM23_30]